MRHKELFNISKSANPKLIKYIDFNDNFYVINIMKINHKKILNLLESIGKQILIYLEI